MVRRATIIMNYIDSFKERELEGGRDVSLIGIGESE